MSDEKKLPCLCCGRKYMPPGQGTCDKCVKAWEQIDKDIEKLAKGYTMNEQLTELEFEAKLLFDELNKKSQQILLIEKSLQEIKANFPFYYHMFTNDTYDRAYYIGWQPMDKGNFRLVVAEEDKKPEVPLKLNLPFCELPLNRRLEFLPYLDKFIKAFTDYLREKKLQLKDGKE